jgi:hypothetical protein
MVPTSLEKVVAFSRVEVNMALAILEAEHASSKSTVNMALTAESAVPDRKLKSSSFLIKFFVF